MKIKEVEKTERRFVLELNEYEAGVLYSITGNISGGGKARKVVDDIYYHLAGMKVDKRGSLSLITRISDNEIDDE